MDCWTRARRCSPPLHSSSRARWLFIVGVGIWGIDIPVAWGFAIANFVWWIGIGHAGTFISAVLLLLRQHWRTSINRFAEAMTLFAAGIAGIFPILHLGRPWFFYWLAAVPRQDGPVAAVAQPAGVGLLRHRHLPHRVAAVLVPRPDPRSGDAARPRQRAASRSSPTGCSRWAGAARRGTGRATSRAYLLLAGLATPLVVSVHSVVSLDFAIGNTPGYHSTDLPAVLRRRRAVLGLRDGADAGIPLRRFFDLHDLITAAASGPCRQGAAGHRRGGRLRLRGRDLHRLLQRRQLRDRDDARPHRPAPTRRSTGPCLAATCCRSQALWWRTRPPHRCWLFVLEPGHQSSACGWSAFMIVVQSMHRDFLPSAWGMFYPTAWDWAIPARLDRLVRAAVPGVRALPAGDLDLRDARAGARATVARTLVMSSNLYGLLAEFAHRRRARRTRRDKRVRGGYRQVEAYSPFPVEGRHRGDCLRAEITFRRSPCSAASSAAWARYFMQWYAATISYPHQCRRAAAAQLADVHSHHFRAGRAGRGALRRGAACCWLNGLPRLRHPLFARRKFRLRHAQPLLPVRAQQRCAVRRRAVPLHGCDRSGADAVTEVTAVRRLLPHGACSALAGCERGMQDMYDQPHHGAAGGQRPVRRRRRLAAAGSRARCRTRAAPSRALSRTLRRGRASCTPARRSARSRIPTRRALALLARGQQRFDIYCAPCHSVVGDGDGSSCGAAFRRRLPITSSACATRRTGTSIDVITHGYGVMYPYADARGAAGPLGHRRLHPRAAAEPARPAERSAGRSPAAVGGGA